MVSSKSISPKKQYAIVSGRFSKSSFKKTLIWDESLKTHPKGDVTETLREFEFTDTEDGLWVKNPPIVKMNNQQEEE